MHTCELFDKYRDGELSVAGRSEFENHLASCEDCRSRKLLLDNVVHLLRSEPVRPLNLADQIARKAFQPKSSWASDVISCLHPIPAVATLTLVIALFSSLWIFSGGSGTSSLYSQYETLLEEADAGHLTALSQASTDSEVVLWLEQEGNSQ